MAIFKCKMCGGNLEVQPSETVGTCDSCGTAMTLPRLDDSKRVNLYDRANHFRRSNEFDKAIGIYEQILLEDRSDAEAYWSLVLCKYGIEYVTDPASHLRVPTCHRTQFTSIFLDEDYKAALANADVHQRRLYEDEAKAIDAIQKRILEIAAREEPFDVFICYKETDDVGKRTPDSVLAQDLYFQLKHEGFKVFFARITLEDKLGSAYEAHIFAALNSAKVMVVASTNPAFLQAVWVKNEWNRYLALIKKGAKKTLIPAYKDMDPYDLPSEFSHLQAQDMGKLGFMQDLVRGIKKIASDTVAPAAATGTAGRSGHAEAAPLLQRALICLEDGDWEKADDLLELVLNLDPKNAHAYTAKLMAEREVTEEAHLANCESPLETSSNYQRAVRFGDEHQKALLGGYNQSITTRLELAQKEEIYERARTQAGRQLESADGSHNSLSSLRADIRDAAAAAALFKSIEGFKNADALARRCERLAEQKRAELVRLAEQKRAELVKLDELQ